MGMGVQKATKDYVREQQKAKTQTEQQQQQVTTQLRLKAQRHAHLILLKSHQSFHPSHVGANPPELAAAASPRSHLKWHGITVCVCV